jgi:4a-hydroxytetrahydrobiopterin dehydratase
METLTQMKCVACREDALTVADAEIAEFHPQVADWEIVELDGIKRLRRVFSFDDFAQALEFTKKVGELAEEEGHHPALLTEWGRTTVIWWMHKIKGLHRNDFIMAKTDELPARPDPGAHPPDPGRSAETAREPPRDSGRPALAPGYSAARALDRRGDAGTLRVAADPAPLVPGVEQPAARIDRSSEHAERAADLLARRRVEAEVLESPGDDTADAVLAVAEARRADLVVIGAHPGGLWQRLFGTRSDEEIARRAPAICSSFASARGSGAAGLDIARSTAIASDS